MASALLEGRTQADALRPSRGRYSSAGRITARRQTWACGATCRCCSRCLSPAVPCSRSLARCAEPFVAGTTGSRRLGRGARLAHSWTRRSTTRRTSTRRCCRLTRRLARRRGRSRAMGPTRPCRYGSTKRWMCPMTRIPLRVGGQACSSSRTCYGGRHSARRRRPCCWRREGKLNCIRRTTPKKMATYYLVRFCCLWLCRGKS
mmetsp:Transcript_50/g.128  ORF Transcript_50/g.128 Transcript_50/m.128 type:complete len:203 (-) Transcript_50:149-757(-)